MDDSEMDKLAEVLKRSNVRIAVTEDGELSCPDGERVDVSSFAQLSLGEQQDIMTMLFADQKGNLPDLLAPNVYGENVIRTPREVDRALEGYSFGYMPPPRRMAKGWMLLALCVAVGALGAVLWILI